MLFAGAQGVGIFTKYLMFGLWTQSWFPVAAILNNYGQMTASEMLAKYGIVVSAGGTPSALNLISGNNLPFVLDHVMKVLGNVDMMMALTPVITMIVFTGSYMAMSGLAQDINGEVQSRGAIGNEAPGVTKQEAMSGVHAAGSPTSPGMLAYSSQAASETLNVGGASALMTEASVQRAANSAVSYGTSLSRAVQAGEGVTLSNGRTVSSEVAQSVMGSLDRSSSAGHMAQALEGRGLNADESMQVIAGIGAVTRGAFTAAKAAGKTDEQAAAEAETAAKGFMNAIGGGVGRALEGLQAELRTNINSSLSSKQGRDQLWNVADKTDAGLRQAAQNAFKTGHSSGDTAQLSNAIQDTDSAQTALQKSIADVDSERTAAQQTRSASGATSINGVTLAQAYQARDGAKAGRNLFGDLLKAYGGDVAAAKEAQAQMQMVEPDRNIATARALITAVNGNILGLNDQNRAHAASALLQTFDGTNANPMGDAQKFAGQTQQHIDDRASAVGQQRAALAGQVKPKTDQAGKLATTAPGRVQGGDPVAPPPGVNPGWTPEGLGGAGARQAIHQQGQQQVDAHATKVPSEQKANDLTGQAASNLNSPLMKPVEWMNGHPELTAAGITGFNFLAGSVTATGAIAAGKKFKDWLKGRGGEPPSGGSPGGPEPGPRPPTQPPEAGAPKSQLPGGGAGPEGAPGGALPEPPPAGGGQWAQVLDKDGNVVGKVAMNAADTAGMSDRAVGEMLAARAAATGGVALRVGGFALDVLGSGPAIGVQLAMEPTTVGAAEPQQTQQKHAVVKALMIGDPGFARQAMQLQRLAADGKSDSPEAIALNNQVQERIRQGMEDPGSIPKPTNPMSGTIAGGMNIPLN